MIKNSGQKLWVIMTQSSFLNRNVLLLFHSLASSLVFPWNMVDIFHTFFNLIFIISFFFLHEKVIVRKGVPAPHPPPPPLVFKAPTSWSSLCLFFKIFIFFPLLSVPPPFKVFKTVPPTLATPFYLNPTTNQPYLIQTNIKRVILPA